MYEALINHAKRSYYRWHQKHGVGIYRAAVERLLHL